MLPIILILSFLSLNTLLGDAEIIPEKSRPNSMDHLKNKLTKEVDALIQRNRPGIEQPNPPDCAKLEADLKNLCHDAISETPLRKDTLDKAMYYLLDTYSATKCVFPPPIRSAFNLLKKMRSPEEAKSLKAQSDLFYSIIEDMYGAALVGDYEKIQGPLKTKLAEHEKDFTQYEFKKAAELLLSDKHRIKYSPDFSIPSLPEIQESAIDSACGLVNTRNTRLWFQKRQLYIAVLLALELKEHIEEKKKSPEQPPLDVHDWLATTPKDEDSTDTNLWAHFVSAAFRPLIQKELGFDSYTDRPGAHISYAEPFVEAATEERLGIKHYSPFNQLMRRRSHLHQTSVSLKNNSYPQFFLPEKCEVKLNPPDPNFTLKSEYVPHLGSTRVNLSHNSTDLPESVPKLVIKYETEEREVTLKPTETEKIKIINPNQLDFKGRFILDSRYFDADGELLFQVEEALTKKQKETNANTCYQSPAYTAKVLDSQRDSLVLPIDAIYHSFENPYGVFKFLFSEDEKPRRKPSIPALILALTDIGAKSDNAAQALRIIHEESPKELEPYRHLILAIAPTLWSKARDILLPILEEKDRKAVLAPGHNKAIKHLKELAEEKAPFLVKFHQIKHLDISDPSGMAEIAESAFKKHLDKEYQNQDHLDAILMFLNNIRAFDTLEKLFRSTKSPEAKLLIAKEISLNPEYFHDDTLVEVAKLFMQELQEEAAMKMGEKIGRKARSPEQLFNKLKDKDFLDFLSFAPSQMAFLMGLAPSAVLHGYGPINFVSKIDYSTELGRTDIKLEILSNIISQKKHPMAALSLYKIDLLDETLLDASNKALKGLANTNSYFSAENLKKTRHNLAHLPTTGSETDFYPSLSDKLKSKITQWVLQSKTTLPNSEHLIAAMMPEVSADITTALFSKNDQALRAAEVLRILFTSQELPRRPRQTRDNQYWAEVIEKRMRLQDIDEKLKKALSELYLFIRSQ